MDSALSLLAAHSSAAAIVAALVLACVSFAILALRRDALWRLGGRIGFFAALTLALLSQGVAPYEPQDVSGLAPLQRLGVYAVEIIWWIGLGRCLTGVVDAFVIFERKPRESRLFQQLIAALIYLCVGFAIVGEVFRLPVGAVFATSGAVAIIAGLALQSTLADVFSGVAISLGRSYRIGDWIALEGGLEGKIIETNWQNVHLLTGTHDLAIIPNSVIAKARLVNQSWPDPARDAKLSVRIRPSAAPGDIVEIALESLASCNLIVHDPPPTVVIKKLSATAIELELKGRAPDRSRVDDARNEMFDHVFRHVAAAGLRFAPEETDAAPPAETDGAAFDAAQRLSESLPLFASLAVEHRTALAARMKRRDYEPGAIVIARGVVAHALGVVQAGALALSQAHEGREHDIVRLGPGDYFGEGGVLLGEPQQGVMRAVTRAVVYEISAEDLAPILRERPTLSHALGEALARRRAMQEEDESAGQRRAGHSARRFADRIKELFALDLSETR